MAKWDTVREQVQKDVQFLVALCNKSAPLGKKSWERSNLGDDPSEAQICSRDYTLKKIEAMNQILKALQVALEGGE